MSYLAGVLMLLACLFAHTALKSAFKGPRAERVEKAETPHFWLASLVCAVLFGSACAIAAMTLWGAL